MRGRPDHALPFGRHRKPPGSLWHSVRFVALGVVIAALASAAVIRLDDHGVRAAVAEQAIEIHSAHGTSYVPALEGKRPLFILALGSDARPGEPVLGERSDSIHILGINLAQRRATILGFPRDSWVDIPGHGTQKITTAMSFGGPQLTVATLERLTGIHIDFWVVTSFSGIIRMVNAIGPLTVRIVQPMHDRFSGADFSAGVHKLNGYHALAFARDRHDVPQGDITRSANQGVLMLAALKKLHHDFENNPAVVFSWLAIGWQNIHTELSPATLLELLLTATQIPSNRVNNIVVPATTGTVGAQSVVFISPGARSIYSDMRADGIVR
jgi:polyisoprenyl-teichoic acid--peptidoglycan teichoic acid transferase